jgi:hypothetical protein
VRAGSIVGSGALMTDEPAEPLRLGDALRLDVRGSDGNSVFGAIDQCVEAAILE